MRQHQLDTLLDELAGAPAPVITITMPTHRQDPNGERDRIRLKNLIKQALRDLQAHTDDRDALARISSHLNGLEAQLDHRQLDHGLAVFVSRNQARQIHLTHTPIERVLVAERFATRELHRDVTEATDVWVLTLSTGSDDTEGTQLYRLHRGELAEHQDDYLPADLPRERETRFADTRTTSAQRDAYIEDFFRRTDEHLATVIGQDPFVLAGIERLRSHYHSVTSLGSQIVAEIDGNWERTPHTNLAKQVEEALDAAQQEALTEMLEDVKEKAGTPAIAVGIDDIANLSSQGRISRLLFEQSFLDPVTVDGVAIGDRVEVIIRQTHEQGGQVVAVPDGALEVEGRIAAEVRW